jgi:hypothetical protein
MFSFNQQLSFVLGLALIISTQGVASEHESTSRFLDFRGDPVLFVRGAPNAKFEFKVHRSITLGPSLIFGQASYTPTLSAGSSTTPEARSGRVLSLGMGSTIYLGASAFEDSWYVYPHAERMFITAGNETPTLQFFGVTFGYKWIWNSGLAINLGLGAQYLETDLSSFKLGKVSATIPAFEFNVGAVF